MGSQPDNPEVLPPMNGPRAPTVRECLHSELRHTLNSRIFYLVTGIGLGLVVAILLSKKKGESIL